ncbi:unnamed protein product [Absidia cylindrospora]
MKNIFILSSNKKSTKEDEQTQYYSKRHEPNSFDWVKRWWYWKTHRPPMWCFRPVKRNMDPSFPWQAFSRQNQKIVWIAFHNHKEAQLVEPRIKQSKALVHVIVQEELAFVLDPDGAQPLLYDIALLPVISTWSWRWK